MKCPVDGCGVNIIYIKVDGDLIPIEVDRVHTLDVKNFNILHLDKNTVAFSEVNHWKNCGSEDGQ